MSLCDRSLPWRIRNRSQTTKAKRRMTATQVKLGVERATRMAVDELGACGVVRVRIVFMSIPPWAAFSPGRGGDAERIGHSLTPVQRT